MNNRFLISVVAAALIAGTGFANAQGPGRDAGSAGSAAQQSAPSSGGASSGTMQRDSDRDSGGKSDMKSTQSEQKSMGAERNQRAEDQKKGGNDMKAEGKDDRGGIKSEQKTEQKSEKGQTTGQGTRNVIKVRRSVIKPSVTRRRPRVAISRAVTRRPRAKTACKPRHRVERGPKHDHYGPGRRGREALDRAAHPDHQCDQGAACFAGDERQLLDFGRHPRPARRDLPRVTVASRDDLSGMAQL